MKSYSSSEVISLLKADGWYHVRTNGDHYQFKHPVKKGTTTVQHPKKDLEKRFKKHRKAIRLETQIKNRQGGQTALL